METTHFQAVGSSLQDKDEQAFRFMDLPAELRKLIYWELLQLKQTEHSGKRVCSNPHIIGVSKDIQREAKAVLYGENIFSICLVNTYDMQRVPYKLHEEGVIGLSLSCEEVNHASARWVNAGRATPSTVPLHLPSALRKAQKIELDLTFTQLRESTGLDRPLFEEGNIHLYNICSYLSTLTSLRQLDISITVNTLKGDTHRALDVLWPLAKLPKWANITVSGLEDGLAAQLQASMGDARLCHDALRQARDIIKKARTLVGVMDLQREGSWGKGRRDRVQAASVILDHLLTRPGYINQHLDITLRYSTADLAGEINRPLIDEVRAAAERLQVDLEAQLLDMARDTSVRAEAKANVRLLDAFLQESLDWTSYEPVWNNITGDRRHVDPSNPETILPVYSR